MTSISLAIFAPLREIFWWDISRKDAKVAKKRFWVHAFLTMKIAFWSAWGIDAIVAVIVLIFFFIGLSDGTVSSFNAGIWCALLGGVAAILVGSCLLRAYVHPLAGLLVAVVLAIPALGALAFFLLILITHPRMN